FIPRHCEERKRRSNPVFSLLGVDGLLRFARNDGGGCQSSNTKTPERNFFRPGASINASNPTPR
ncbi:MAG: hypothetical protein WA820_00450, partial [Bradyrhizobium sp.]